MQGDSNIESALNKAKTDDDITESDVGELTISDLNDLAKTVNETRRDADQENDIILSENEREVIETKVKSSTSTVLGQLNQVILDNPELAALIADRPNTVEVPEEESPGGVLESIRGFFKGYENHKYLGGTAKLLGNLLSFGNLKRSAIKLMNQIPFISMLPIQPDRMLAEMDIREGIKKAGAGMEVKFDGIDPIDWERLKSSYPKLSAQNNSTFIINGTRHFLRQTLSKNIEDNNGDVSLALKPEVTITLEGLIEHEIKNPMVSPVTTTSAVAPVIPATAPAQPIVVTPTQAVLPTQQL